ncbi:unnamed protein product [Vitrella brassicaformis CCMP3155]|uniref:Aminotransferase class I/classII domain-containing protein n=1 Tax=Vitrella brassicaformis (strain CCMP3155) TaxID=1169540 RepID=A0A0G4H5V0_VITBC|nr:unnamed protein product [Vitrella brassicaformis CCMP3155]|mmetsp:Transcript_47163/g.117671  ORF Transcript_47163/g.117671 Transcript_47163/m.117671 type:complete len:448 (-) Transcript_47163:183-1526(-)|eukprot:CEM39222.1 unnamed protein product [Vitrella brassicaformis CCMP3155]
MVLHFSKDIKTPDPVPQEGIQRAVAIMSEGRMYRYNHSDNQSDVSLCEREFAKYVGLKYAVGVNSCGSAIFLALKCVGVQSNDVVLCNGFSFTAVPSAVEHCGARPVFVDCTDHYVIDPTDLERKAKMHNARYLCLTYMRGKVPDMCAVMDVCRRLKITLVEDAAHALGVRWNGTLMGNFGKAACFSSQSYKLLNSGEGGFLATNDDVIAAKAICYAGCYEKLYEKHIVAPPKAVFERIKRETPNYSLRMSNLAASVLLPQIATIEQRIQTYNRRYYRLQAQLESGSAYVRVPRQYPAVSIVGDSIQFNLVGECVTPAATQAFLSACAKRGVPVSIFGDKDNARNIRNWRYCDLSDLNVPSTEEMIPKACDVRLPLQFDDGDFDVMGAVILEAMNETLPPCGPNSCVRAPYAHTNGHAYAHTNEHTTYTTNGHTNGHLPANVQVEAL